MALLHAMHLRRAVRALVVDEADRLLLVRFAHHSGAWIWALPGGGIEPDEAEVDALHRELAEELGLVDAVLEGPVWERTHLFTNPVPETYDGQTERIYVVRCAAFDPAPQHTWEQLEDEGMSAIRWWTLGELEATADLVAPSRLVALTRELLAAGLPPTVIDVGE